jgi:hypothetical protein
MFQNRMISWKIGRCNFQYVGLRANGPAFLQRGTGSEHFPGLAAKGPKGHKGPKGREEARGSLRNIRKLALYV